MQKNQKQQSKKVRLNVLGRFEALDGNGQEITLPTRKAEILLTRMAISLGQSFPRSMLAGMLWSDRGEEQARNSLRQTLSALKKAFDGMEPSPLHVGRTDVMIAPNTIEVDVVEIGQLLSDQNPNSVEKAAQLARGEFLEGIATRDPVAEEWLSEQRGHYRRTSITALETYLESLLDSGDPQDACEVGEKLVRLEPVSESAWRLLMKAYCRHGERNHALLAFRRCVETLESELQISPSEESVALKESIESGHFGQEVQEAQHREDLGYESGESIEKQLFTDSGRPSIAVLPFQSLVQDGDDSFFSYGLTEDLIECLSRYRELIVIHMDSMENYADSDIDLNQVSRELDVGYVVQGNVRQANGKYRVSVKLLDASTGKTLLSKRMDRVISNLFEMEDEIASLVASNLVSHLETESLSRANRKPTTDMTAYECVIRARPGSASYESEDRLAARSLLEQAITLDPGYATAHALLSWTYIIEFDAGDAEDPYKSLERAAAFARKAISLDEFESNAHTGMGWAYLYQRKYDLAEIHLNRALECNPNDENALCIKSWLLALCGRISEVEVCGSMALRLNPLAPDDCLMAMVISEYLEGDFEQSMVLLDRLQGPDPFAESWRAACHACLGQDSESGEAAARAIEYGGDELRRKSTWERSWPFRDPEDMNRLLDGLRKSGIVQD